MPIQAGAEARLLGKLGATKRWANSTPEQRAEASRRMRQGMRERYVERAKRIAAEAGYVPSDKQLGQSAKLLHEADLAERRYRAWLAAAGRRGAVPTADVDGVDAAGSDLLDRGRHASASSELPVRKAL